MQSQSKQEPCMRGVEELRLPVIRVISFYEPSLLDCELNFFSGCMTATKFHEYYCNGVSCIEMVTGKKYFVDFFLVGMTYSDGPIDYFTLLHTCMGAG